MTKAVRKTLFWGFIILFLITAPIVVLYTAGYRFIPGMGRIVRTGVLSINTIPRNVEIYIDGERHRMDSPSVVKNLEAKDYVVRLEKNGFLSWEKTVTIEPQKTSFLDSVVIWGDSAPSIYETRSDSILVNPPNNAAATIESSGAWVEVWIEELENNSRSLIARFAGTEEEKVGMQWSPDGSMLLLSNNGEILVANRDGSQQNTISDLTPATIQSVYWDEGTDRSLILTTQTNTFRVNPPNKELELLLDVPVSSVISHNSDIYYPDNSENQTVIIRKSGKDEEPVAILPKGEYQFISSRLPYLLLYNESRERIVLLDANVFDQPILLNTEAFSAQWAPEGNRLLYTNGFETHIFHPESNKDTLITRVSNPILTATWHPVGSTVVLAHPNEMIAYDLNEKNGFATTTLNRAQNVGQIFIEDKGRTLYFLGNMEGVYGLHRQVIR